jgi:hypothetical protein
LETIETSAGLEWEERVNLKAKVVCTLGLTFLGVATWVGITEKEPTPPAKEKDWAHITAWEFGHEWEMYDKCEKQTSRASSCLRDVKEIHEEAMAIGLKEKTTAKYDLDTAVEVDHQREALYRKIAEFRLTYQ